MSGPPTRGAAFKNRLSIMATEIRRTKIKDLLAMQAGSEVLVKGWVRTKRGNREIAFIALNDGSTIKNVQIVVDKNAETESILPRITTGACIGVRGDLVESLGSGQAVEIHAKDIEIFGECDPMRFPLQKKDTSFEYLRTVAHMRPRTNTFGAVLRLRSQMAYAIHEYFHKRGFVYLHTPLITASDCEGAGQMFQVTTLDLNNVPKTKKGEPERLHSERFTPSVLPSARRIPTPRATSQSSG